LTAFDRLHHWNRLSLTAAKKRGKNNCGVGFRTDGDLCSDAVFGRNQTTFYPLALLGLISTKVCATRRGEC